MGEVIAQRSAVALYLDSVVDAAIDLFITPLANADPAAAPTSVVEDIEGWMQQDRGHGGRKGDPHSIRYTVLAVLVGFYLLMRQSQKVSIAGVLQALLFEMSPDQRIRLGMTGDLTGTRADDMALTDDPAATPQQQLAGRKARDREYARLAKFISAMFDGFDPSPFHKAQTLTRAQKEQSKASKARQRAGESLPEDASTLARRSRVKMTNDQRDAILADPDHPDRRIDDATSARNHERLLDVMNKVVAAAAMEAPTGTWAGDLATDETIVITLPMRYRHGLQGSMLVSADPDAEWWNGKADEDDAKEDSQRGFGYGITFLIRMGRPYERRIPELALGIHIGPPTGGRSKPVREALQRAERHRLTANKRQRRLIADQGFTKLDDWLPLLHEHGYSPVQDYAKTWSRDIPITDTTAAKKDRNGKREKKRAAHGPRLIAGRIRCPGAQGLHDSQMVRPHNETSGPETDADILTRHRQVEFLDALAMPVKMGPVPDKNAEPGRPKPDAPKPDTWAITVQCPASLGLVNCALVARGDGLRDPKLPDVPNPPQVPHPDLLPGSCRNDHVTLHLPLTHAKRLQPFTWGSHQWADAYRPMRSSNERYHSQYKHANSGGVKESWLEMRGIAKSGLLAAIASAVTTQHLIGDFRTKHTQPDGKATFGPREEQRRHRQQVINRAAQPRK